MINHEGGTARKRRDDRHGQRKKGRDFTGTATPAPLPPRRPCPFSADSADSGTGQGEN